MRESYVILLFLVFVTLAGAKQCMVEDSLETGGGARVMLEVEGIGTNTSKEYIYSGNAIGLLKEEHNVKGIVSISCINDICQGRDYVWMFYVNGELMNKAPGHYKVQRGDVISYKLEKI